MNVSLQLFIILLSVLYIRTYEVPTWQMLQDNLHKKIEEIFKRDQAVNVNKGRFFKHALKEDLSGYKAVEYGRKTLPKWLTFDANKNVIQGILLDEEIHKNLKIVFLKDKENAVNGFADGTKSVNLDVKSQTLFDCKYEPTTVASVIFHADFNNFDAVHRIKFLRNFAHYMGLSIYDFHVTKGNVMDDASFSALNIRKAGPGDTVPNTRQQGMTVSWKVKCGIDITGDERISKLVECSQKEDFKSVFTESVIGWIVTSSKSTRAKRAVAGTPFPGGTPSASAGTPTLGPPSATVSSTGMIKPTPTKSSVMMTMTSMPVTQPPKTKRMTTESSTTEQKTTEKPTSKQTTARSTSKTMIATTDDIIDTTTKATTKKPVITTEKKTVLDSTKAPLNHPPKLREDGFGEISVVEGQAFQVEVPMNMFSDEDGDNLDITFRYYADNGDDAVPAPSNYWITYRNYYLYMLPHKGVVKDQRFVLTATDPSGAYVNDVFTVKIRNDPNVYNILFNATLDLDFNEYNKSVEKKVKLIQDLARAMTRDNIEFDYKKLRSLEFYPGSLIVRWGVDGAEFADCNNVDVQYYINLLQSAEFTEAMLPTTVDDVGVMQKKQCVITGQTKDDGDDGLWQRILIPVIVIVVILLIIALIMCCVYRHRRKYEPPSEQDSDYFNRKKPVIFLEEYEEKQDFVSLQPLILPNEKPPVQQAYEPRADTPDGPSSSGTGSTENEEKELLPPSSPSDGPRKGFNAPPPYSAR